MDMQADAHKLAQEFRERLRPMFGHRLRGVVLYGSHARGQADEGSDIDLLVLLEDIEDFWGDLRRIGPLAAEISLAHDAVLSATPIGEAAFSSSELPIVRTARQEGIVLR